MPAPPPSNPLISICPVCERPAKSEDARAPQLFTTFVTVLPNGGVFNVPVHLACFVDLIAGRVQEAVLYTLQTEELSVGIERNGAELGDVIGSVVGSIISNLTRKG